MRASRFFTMTGFQMCSLMMMEKDVVFNDTGNSLNPLNTPFIMFSCFNLPSGHLKICNSAISVWLEDFLSYKVLCSKLVMTSRAPAACDDPRDQGFPCYSNHKPGKMRQNQSATWMSCSRCGLRLQYTSKGAHRGNRRQMGPEPHLIKLTMLDLEASTPATEMSAEKVNVKLMEIKGKIMQWGVPTNVALNMTYDQYLKRLESNGPSDHSRVDPKETPVRSIMGYPQEAASTRTTTTASLVTRELESQEMIAVQSSPNKDPPAKATATKAKSPTPPPSKAAAPRDVKMESTPISVKPTEVVEIPSEEEWVNAEAAAPSDRR